MRGVRGGQGSVAHQEGKVSRITQHRSENHSHGAEHVGPCSHVHGVLVVGSHRGAGVGLEDEHFLDIDVPVRTSQ